MLYYLTFIKKLVKTMKTLKINLSREMVTDILILLSFLTLCCLLLITGIDSALAQSPFDAITNVGEESTNWATTSLMVIVGAIAIVAVAIGMLAGKFSWQIAATVISAIIIGFNARNIVQALGGL